jgi:hypothetical protein
VIGGYLHLTRDPQVMATSRTWVIGVFRHDRGVGNCSVRSQSSPRVSAAEEWAYAGFFSA